MFTMDLRKPLEALAKSGLSFEISPDNSSRILRVTQQWGHSPELGHTDTCIIGPAEGRLHLNIFRRNPNEPFLVRA